MARKSKESAVEEVVENKESGVNLTLSNHGPSERTKREPKVARNDAKGWTVITY